MKVVNSAESEISNLFMTVDAIIVEYSSALLQYPDTESFSNCRVVISKEEAKESKYGGAAAETIDLCD